MIYLDHAATTPVDPRVAAFMAAVLAENLGNPGSNHAPGRRASALIEAAREQVAALVGVAADTIVFTSGATESNNLAITGSVRAQWPARRRTAHVVTLTTEHKAVLAPVKQLERAGVAASYLTPDAQGLLGEEALATALRDDTLLVTLLHANSETGVVQDIATLARVCRARGVPLHVDAAQSAGKLALPLADVDYLSFTAHKLGGPQGIGALHVAPARRAMLLPQIVGGGQERGLRSGTLATHQIAGFGLACELAAQQRDADSARIGALRERLRDGLLALPGVLLNGHPTQRLPGILNLSFEGVEGESLFTGLPGLAVSTGSACSSSSGEPSYVLRALGRDTELAQASLRFSLGRATTRDDIDGAIAAVRGELLRLRGLGLAAPPPVDGWSGPRTRVVSGEAGAVRLGTRVRFLLRVEGEVVRAARFQAYGCPHTLAACGHLCARLVGRTRPALVPGTPREWLDSVGAPVEKLGRMLIIEDALQASLAVW